VVNDEQIVLNVEDRPCALIGAAKKLDVFYVRMVGLANAYVEQSSNGKKVLYVPQIKNGAKSVDKELPGPKVRKVYYLTAWVRGVC
jgi:hypothetical protein